MRDQEKTKARLIEDLEELRSRVASSHEGETRLRRLMETVSLGVTECDTEGVITLVNPAYERMTGYTGDELVGMRVADLVQDGPERKALDQCIRHLVLEQPTPSPYCCKDVTKDGRLIDVQVDWAYKRNAHGQITGFTSIISDITERKRAEKAIRSSEAKYRQLHETMRDAFVSVDMNGRIQEYNEAYRVMLGYEHEELAARTFWDLTPEKWHKLQAEIIDKQVLVRGYSDLYEKEYRRKDGSLVPLELRTKLLRDDRGEPCGMWAIMRDITERKRAEEASKNARDELERRVEQRTAELKKANEELSLFQKFAESSSQGFGMADLEGRIAYVNPAMCRMIGEADPANAIGRPMWAYYQESVKERRTNEILPALERDGFWDGELPMLSPQGTIAPPLHHVFLLRDAKGKPFRRCAVVTDLTERKRAEEALRQSDERVRTICNSALDAVVMIDASGNVLYWNPAAERMFGYSSQDMIGREVHAILTPKAYRDQALRGFREFAVSGAGRAVGHILELTALRKDGTEFPIEMSVAAFEILDRSYAAAIVRDITERKQTQEALKRERQTLEHMLEASDHERQLIAYDIHDGLAQYLTGAMMQIEHSHNIREDRPKDSETAYQAGMEMLRQSHFEARRLISGVRPPILDESGVVAAIAHLVYEVRSQKGPKAEFHGKVDFGRLAPTLENSIYRIVQEGLTNAAKHSHSERVRVALVQRGDQVRIVIRDQGVGFDPKTVEEGRFGLEGIRERARLLGGKAIVDSKPGKGTRIVVDLPVVLRKENDD